MQSPILETITGDGNVELMPGLLYISKQLPPGSSLGDAIFWFRKNGYRLNPQAVRSAVDEATPDDELFSFRDFDSGDEIGFYLVQGASHLVASTPFGGTAVGRSVVRSNERFIDICPHLALWEEQFGGLAQKLYDQPDQFTLDVAASEALEFNTSRPRQC